jgi:hypothetical protein
MHIFTLMMWVWQGMLNANTLAVSITLMPAAAIGWIAGHALTSKIDRDLFSRCVLVGLFVVGVVNTSKLVIFIAKELHWTVTGAWHAWRHTARDIAEVAEPTIIPWKQ